MYGEFDQYINTFDNWAEETNSSGGTLYIGIDSSGSLYIPYIEPSIDVLINYVNGLGN